MAIKFIGRHACFNCGKTFEWCYNEPIRTRGDAPASAIIAEDFPEGKNLVNSCVRKRDGNYEIGAYCDSCGILNTFDYTP